MTAYFYTRTLRKNILAPLYFRFNSGHTHLVVKTIFIVNSNDWSNKTKTFRQQDFDLKRKLELFIESVVVIYNESGGNMSLDKLSSVDVECIGKSKMAKPQFLLGYIEYFS
jgi:hypothetical protein